MAILAGHFDLLKKRIEPTPERAEAARDMPARVRDYLQAHEDFVTEHPHTRLAGSYGRSTAIKDIKDVDVLVFADQGWRDRPIPDMINTLCRALRGLPEALDDCGDVSVRKQRRSVNVYLEKHDLSLDVVPVLKTTANHQDQVEVPDRAWDDWVFTHPLGYGCDLSDLNGGNGGKAVPTIKLFKHWRDTHFQKNKPKSYWLECVVVQHIKRGWVTTPDKGYGTLFADLCNSIYERFMPYLETEEEVPFIPDPRLRNHVAWNWKRNAFETLMRRLDETRGWARRAVDATDQETAVALWKKVFGPEWFPSTDEVNAGHAQAGLQSAAGALSVAAAGTVLTQRPTSGASVASPAKRFFGEGKLDEGKR